MVRPIVIFGICAFLSFAPIAEARVDCIANGSLGEGCYDCTWRVLWFPVFGCFEVLYSAYCGCDTSTPGTCSADGSMGFCDYEGPGPGCEGPICPEG